jgi:hypothetical protein
MTFQRRHGQQEGADGSFFRSWGFVLNLLRAPIQLPQALRWARERHRTCASNSLNQAARYRQGIFPAALHSAFGHTRLRNRGHAAARRVKSLRVQMNIAIGIHIILMHVFAPVPVS